MFYFSSREEPSLTFTSGTARVRRNYDMSSHTSLARHSYGA